MISSIPSVRPPFFSLACLFIFNTCVAHCFTWSETYFADIYRFFFISSQFFSHFSSSGFQPSAEPVGPHCRESTELHEGAPLDIPPRETSYEFSKNMHDVDPKFSPLRLTYFNVFNDCVSYHQFDSVESFYHFGAFFDRKFFVDLWTVWCRPHDIRVLFSFWYCSEVSSSLGNLFTNQ